MELKAIKKIEEHKIQRLCRAEMRFLQSARTLLEKSRIYESRRLRSGEGMSRDSVEGQQAPSPSARLRRECRVLGKSFALWLREHPDSLLALALNLPKGGSLALHQGLAILPALSNYLMPENHRSDFYRFASLNQKYRGAILSEDLRNVDSLLRKYIQGDWTLTETFADKVFGKGKNARTSVGPKKKIVSAPEILRHLDSVAVGQPEAKQALALAAWRHQLLCGGEKGLPKGVLLLAGPTGCGKTLLCSGLAGLLEVPFVSFAATQLSANAYVGSSVEDILTQLLKAAKGNLELAQKGIVFLDEVDKLRNVDARQTNSGIDVKGASVQQELLVMIEGGVMKTETRNSFRAQPDFDTRGVLFILGGAFSDLDEIRNRRLAKAQGRGRLGFADSTAPSGSAEPDGINPVDLVGYGFLPEFVGRISRVVKLHALAVQEMVNILDRPNEGLLHAWVRLFHKTGAELEWDLPVLETLAAQALSSGSGARGLKSVLETLLGPALYQANCQISEGKVVLRNGADGIEVEVLGEDLREVKMNRALNFG